jgi:hypothetical protein
MIDKYSRLIINFLSVIKNFDAKIQTTQDLANPLHSFVAQF